MSKSCALLADIGGTNVRFQIVLPDGTALPSQVLTCADFAEIDDAIRAHIDHIKPDIAPKCMVLAVAGPPEGEFIQFTNQTWSFYKRDIVDHFNLETLRVINDFTAVALAVPVLDKECFQQIGDGIPNEEAPYSVLGPGTGLGVSSVVPIPGMPNAEPVILTNTEGGHFTLPPMTERESAVLSVLRRHYNHVSAERVLSGPGIVNIYESLCEIDGVDPIYDHPAAITEAALEKHEHLPVVALEMFCAFLGTAASNVCITVSAYGGVYLAGGILPRLGNFFLQSKFRKRFETKGRFSHYLESTPTYIITHKLPAMEGLKTLIV